MIGAMKPDEVVENKQPGDPRARPLRLFIAEGLGRMMDRSGMSQAAIGRVLDVSRATMTSWRKGRTQPSLEQLAMLCFLMGVSADELLGTHVTEIEPPGPDATPEQLEVAKHAIRGAWLLAMAIVRIWPVDVLDPKTARARATFERMQNELGKLDEEIVRRGIDVVSVNDGPAGARRLEVALRGFEQPRRQRGRADAPPRAKRERRRKQTRG